MGFANDGVFDYTCFDGLHKPSDHGQSPTMPGSAKDLQE